MRRCTKCFKEHDGDNPNCASCKRAYQKAYHSSEANKRRAKNLEYIRIYGITLDDYDKLCEEQNYKCLICNKEKKLYVDHKDKKVRGLLCHNCNVALGHFGENVEYVRKALQYLERSLV